MDRTVLLSDEPADWDEFGGHGRVAQALAGLIEADDGGRTIGLEGGWGSGKSTVVRLLSERLSNDTAVFTFDAWAHEEDPLRRSFLESLIDFAKGRHWLSDVQAWQDEADRLARRRRETEQHSDQHLTSSGRVITAALLFVPVGSATMNWALGQASVNLLWVVLSVLVTLAPLLVIGWLLGKSWVRGIGDDGSPRDKPKDDPLSILGESSTVHQKSLTVEDHDPTSVEFEKVFRRLLSDVLEDESRRLVLVLDNLDRVGPETSGRVLATLQTFINFSSRIEVSKRVWILLPYDREGFKKLWGDATDQQLDKICQARFYVPPVLIADWQAYFKDRLIQAMPARARWEVDDAVRVAVAAQVDGFWPSHPSSNGSAEKDGAFEGLSPSPRDMILLANDVAALELQRSDVDLKYLAYYAILRRRYVSKDVRSFLVAGDMVTTRAAPILGPDGTENLAALHFNATVEHSKQVLLAEPATHALRRGDGEGLANLATFPGFWEVLQSLPYSDWTTGGANDLALTGSALEQADLLDDVPNAVAEPLTVAVKSHNGPWGPLSYEAGRGLASLISLPSIDVNPSSVLSNFNLHRSEDGQKDRADRVRALVGFVEVLDAANVELPRVPVEAEAETFVELCGVIARVDASRTVWRLLEPTASPEEIAPVVATWAGEAPQQARSLGTLNVLLAGSALRDAQSQVSEAFVSYLQGTLGDASPQTQFAVQILFRLQPHSPGSSQVIAEDGTLLDVFYAFQAAEEHDRAAEAAVLYLLLLPDVPEPPAKGDSTTGAAVLREMLNRQEPDPVQDAVMKLLVADDAALAYSIAKSATALSRAVSTAIRSVLRKAGVSADRLIDNWETISELAEDIPSLVKANGSELAHRIMSTELPPQLESVLLKAALEKPEVAWAGLVLDSFRSRFELMSQNEWTGALESGGHDMDLLNLLVRGGAGPSLDVKFQEALIELGKSLVEGETAPVDERYEDLPRVLSADHHRGTVAGKLAGPVVDAGEDLTPQMFTVFGPLLRSSQHLLAHPRLISNFIADSVRGDNTAVISWCAELLAEKPDLLRNHAHEMENLKGLVRAALESRQTPELDRLAVAIGVELPDATEADESQ